MSGAPEGADGAVDATPDPSSLVDPLVERAKRIEADYAGDRDRPLGSLAALMGAYGVLVTGLGVAVARRRRLPDRFGLADLALVTVATYRLSRTLAKDPVTSPLRAPFTRLQGTTGPAELKEDVPHTGVRHAIGELVTCPFCLGQWVATGFVGGLLLAPRATRAVAVVLTAVAGADVLQFAYSALEQAVEGEGS